MFLLFGDALGFERFMRRSISPPPGHRSCGPTHWSDCARQRHPLLLPDINRTVGRGELNLRTAAVDRTQYGVVEPDPIGRGARSLSSSVVVRMVRCGAPFRGHLTP